MTEWSIFGIIAALAGFLATVTTPIIKLNTSITELVTLVRRIEADTLRSAEKNADAHRRFWEKIAEQDKILSDHEVQIGKREVRNEEKTAPGA